MNQEEKITMEFSDGAKNFELSEQSEEISISLASIEFYNDAYQPNNLSQNHWHYSIQFNLITKGTLRATIEGEEILIYKGQGILINSNILHRLAQEGGQCCTTVSIQIPLHYICPKMETDIYQKYIVPIVNNPSAKYILLKEDGTWRSSVLLKMNKAIECKLQKDTAYELQIKAFVLDAWVDIIKNIPVNGDTLLDRLHLTQQSSRVKAMLSFIEENYSEKITLSRIADAADISICECNRCFRNVLHLTPIEYLIQYRIIAGCRLLSTTNLSIAQVAGAAGFTEMSYFYKIFKKYTGYTPKKYRNTFHDLHG